MKASHFLVLCVLLLFPFSVHAQDDPIRTLQLASLKGLGRVTVVVTTAGGQGVIETESLRTSVELKLRSVGVKVVSKHDAKQDDGFLWITISALKIEELPVYACSISVELKQIVNPLRNPQLKLLGATWHSGGAAAIGRDKLRETVRDYVSQFVEKFANDYLSVNEP